MIVPSYVVFSLTAAFAFAMSGIVNKLVSKHAVSDRWTLLGLYYLTFLPFMILVPYFTAVVWPTSIELWAEIVGYSVLFLIGNICFFTAIFKTDATVFAPFFQLQAAFLAILAYLFLGERFSGASYFWIGALLIGAVFVSIDEKMSWRSFFNRSILLIVAMQFFHAGMNLLAGLALKSINSWNLLLWTTLVSNVLVLTFLSSINRLRIKVSVKQITPMLLEGAMAFVGASAIYRAFEENVTISSALSLLTGPVTFIIVVLAAGFNPRLLEHHTRRVYIIRGVGVLLTLVSAVMLSI